MSLRVVYPVLAVAGTLIPRYVDTARHHRGVS